jgi:catechol 2,3-dioxygenase-like lactoylglutathione lyase family enzyme
MNAQPFRLDQIGLVMPGVESLARSIEFYRDRLGLNVKDEIPGPAFIDAGPVTLCLSEPLAKASGHITGATGVVFPVESLRKAHSALQTKQVGFLNEPRNVTGSSWAANFTDPDGHRLSIFGPE